MKQSDSIKVQAAGAQGEPPRNRPVCRHKLPELLICQVSHKARRAEDLDHGLSRSESLVLNVSRLQQARETCGSTSAFVAGRAMTGGCNVTNMPRIVGAELQIPAFFI